MQALLRYLDETWRELIITRGMAGLELASYPPNAPALCRAANDWLAATSGCEPPARRARGRDERAHCYPTSAPCLAPQALRRAVPEAKLNVSGTPGGIVISGSAATPADAQKVRELARQYIGDKETIDFNVTVRAAL
jgi:hypothetical protein